MASLPRGMTVTQVGTTRIGGQDHLVLEIDYRRYAEELFREASEYRRSLMKVKSTSRRFQAGTRRTKHAAKKRKQNENG